MSDNANKLVETVWPISSRKPRLANRDVVKSLTCEAYYKYYERQVFYMVPPAGSPIIDIIQMLQTNPDRETAVGSLKLQTPIPSNDECDLLVNLAARLLLMLKFGKSRQQAFPPEHLNWNSGILSDFVEEHFASPPKLSHEGIRLPKLFNAWSIAVVAGIEINFTDDLADHLRLIDDDSKVLIFHHASFLELQQNSIFPDGFVDETIHTLALLFPQADFSPTQHLTIRNRSKRKWLRALRQKYEGDVIDPRLVLCGNLNAENRQIDCFQFWRDRLIILKQAYDEATPRTFSQWWHDERDGVRWSTFWVAILVLIITTLLGIVQCVEGALQVYYGRMGK